MLVLDLSALPNCTSTLLLHKHTNIKLLYTKYLLLYKKHGNYLFSCINYLIGQVSLKYFNNVI